MKNKRKGKHSKEDKGNSKKKKNVKNEKWERHSRNREMEERNKVRRKSIDYGKAQIKWKGKITRKYSCKRKSAKMEVKKKLK